MVQAYCSGYYFFKEGSNLGFHGSVAKILTADCINLATDIQNSKTSLLRLPQSFVFKSTVVLEIRLFCCKISAICCTTGGGGGGPVSL